MGALRKQHVTAVVKVGGTPDWQVAAYGALWVANDQRALVSRIDARTNKVVATVHVAQPCAGMAAAGGSLWIPDCSSNSVLKVDPASNRVVGRVRTGIASSESYIAAGAGSVWVVSDVDRVTRFDPRTGKVVARIAVPSGAGALAYGFGAVWMSDYADSLVVKIDASANKVAARYPVGNTPLFIAAGAGAVWTLDQGDGKVSRVDPQTGAVTLVPAESPGQGGCIATGVGGVWVTIPGAPVTRIDPATAQVTQQYRGVGGDCISVGYGSVWLSNNQLGNVWRIKAFS